MKLQSLTSNSPATLYGAARLRINYRTTDETRRLAVGILEGVEVDDLDGGRDHQRFYHSLMHGPEPEVQCFANLQEQAEAIVETLAANQLAPEDCCVIARTNRELLLIQDSLEQLGQSCHLLTGRSSQTPTGAINLATMHRVKGLEFDAVFIASVNRNLVPLDYVLRTAADPVTRRQRENEERALLYVSLTRARKLAFVYGYGEMSAWFEPQLAGAAEDLADA